MCSFNKRLDTDLSAVVRIGMVLPPESFPARLSCNFYVCSEYLFREGKLYLQWKMRIAAFSLRPYMEEQCGEDVDMMKDKARHLGCTLVNEENWTLDSYGKSAVRLKTLLAGCRHLPSFHLGEASG